MIPGYSRRTRNCIQCYRILALNERIKIVKTRGEAIQLTAQINKAIEIGDTFCNNCRINLTRITERYFKCIQCNKLCPVAERKRVLMTNKDTEKLAPVIDIPVRIGDTLCNRCRITSSRKSQRRSADTTECDPTSAKKRELQSSLPKLDIEIESSKPTTRSAKFHVGTTSMPSSSEPSKQLSRNDEHTALSTIHNTPSDCSSISQPLSQGSSIEDPTFQPPSDRPSSDEQYVLMPFKRPAATHKYCCICGAKSGLVVIPFQARLRLYIDERIYIPIENRCCPGHLLKDRLYADDIKKMAIISSLSYIPVTELKKFLDTLSLKVDETLLNKIGDYNMPEDRIFAITGYTWENIVEVRNLLKSMRNSHIRDITQALVVFLFKLRSGNSNSTIASILGIEHEQAVSKFVSQIIRAYEIDVLPNYFGIGTISREELISNHTTDVVKELLDVSNQLVIICDGTYLRHEKSGNNYYQRKSFSGQKKAPLCKPFTICSSDGYIIDIAGPFLATENDAVIMKKVMSNPTGLSSILQRKDIFVLDRGFRDIVSFLEEKDFEVMMPALKGKNKQLTCEQSNHSRIVTKIRWPVESVHGVLGQKNRLLHHQFSNKMLPQAKSIVRIAGFMYNKFCKRLGSDGELRPAIVDRMNSRKALPNDLSVEMEEKRWARRKTLFHDLTADKILDFPELTLDQLKLLFTGSYQLKQALSYLSELMGDRDDMAHVSVGILKEPTTPLTHTIKFVVQSRHMNSRKYRCFIRYLPSVNEINGIAAYVCECANGNRTVGTCSHIAALIYYLAHGRYQARIVRPNEVLSRLFVTGSENIVINEDSDED